MDRIKKTAIGGSLIVATFDLTERQHEKCVQAVQEEKRRIGHYTFKDVNEEFIYDWLEDSKDEEYTQFLKLYTEQGEECLSISDEYQVLGEIIVYSE